MSNLVATHRSDENKLQGIVGFLQSSETTYFLRTVQCISVYFSFPLCTVFTSFGRPHQCLF